MFQIKVTLFDGTIFLFTSDSHDIADVRMWELQHDLRVKQATWLPRKPV